MIVREIHSLDESSSTVYDIPYKIRDAVLKAIDPYEYSSPSLSDINQIQVMATIKQCDNGTFLEIEVRTAGDVG